jgi:S1-C subfamily serine protease
MSGAGVVIDDSGQILTARHVVTGSESIEVTFADGTQSSATIASEQADNDIAVLVADTLPSVIVPAVLGGGVRIGDDVYATGHPFELYNSLSAGVVSGLNRTVPIAESQTLTGLIQFDAAVNPGNSGGPLLNRAGQIVGIVTALANPAQEGFFVGVGFAVPIATAGGAAGAPQQ